MRSEDRKDQMGELASSILQIVPLIYRRVIRKNEMLEGTNGNYPRMGILVSLLTNGPQPPSAIALLHSYSRQNLTTLTDRLEADGLVTRVRDASDRRVINLVLTDEGRNYIGYHKECMKQALVDELASLDDSEVETLLSSFENIRRIYLRIIETSKSCTDLKKW